MKFKVNDNCIGCGACTAVAPEVFELNDEGLAAVKEQPTDSNIEEAKDAMDGCPVSAIEKED